VRRTGLGIVGSVVATFLGRSIHLYGPTSLWPDTLAARH
jgi:uncharacterized membrane protein YeaQ/YmgE (transglycosylase-associated protein family)